MYVWCFGFVEWYEEERKWKEEGVLKKSGRSGGVEEVSALAVDGSKC